MKTKKLIPENIILKMKNYETIDYIRAKERFKLASLEDKEMAFGNLFDILLRQGKYQEARDLINNNYQNNIMFNKTFARLERIEMNYQDCFNYYKLGLEETDFQHHALLEIACLNMQLGNYQTAIKIFETLQLNHVTEVIATIELIDLYIFQKEYRLAYNEYLKLREMKIINEDFLLSLRRITKILECHGFKVIKGNFNDMQNDYFIERLLNDKEENLVKHIERHKERRRDTYLKEDVDISKLIAVSKREIANKNPSVFREIFRYYLLLDEKVGYVGCEETSNIAVITIADTNQILTIYPVILSSEFDKNNNLSSKELKLKRERGFRDGNR